MNRKIEIENADRLYAAILTMQTPEECERFFDDLCTIVELKAMAQRFRVAEMLDNGIVYSDIVADTGASTATISRVNRSLMYGSNGYTLAIKRMKGEPDV